jgi:uncharacterized protein YegL
VRIVCAENLNIPHFPALSPKTFEQLVILVLDGSSSMNEIDDEEGVAKAEAAGNAARKLAERLQKSGRSNDFWFAFISFSNRVEIRLKPTPMIEMDPSILQWNPYLGGSTAIGDALYVAGEMTSDFLSRESDLPKSVGILLLSDGINDSGKDPLLLSDKLKQKWPKEKLRIITVAYGKNANTYLLNAIASDHEKATPDKYNRFIDFGHHYIF